LEKFKPHIGVFLFYDILLNMETLYYFIWFGVFGGVIRALVGISKYYEKNKKERRIRFGYLSFSLFVSALVGGVAGALVGSDWRFAIIAGYAGADFLEGLYKIRMKQGFEI